MDRLGPERVEEILGAIPGVTTLVVGDLMLDRYITGTVDRISPEAPVPVVRVEGESSAIGGAANVAANAVALGARCIVVGCAGEDPEGDALRRELEAARVGTEGLVLTTGRPTTVKTRVLARHQQVVRFDLEEDRDVPDGVAEELAARIRELTPRCQVLVVEDYNKGILVDRVIRQVLETAREAEVPTVVDPKRRRFWEYRGAFLFKPNAKELGESLGGVPIHPNDPEWMEDVRRRLGCENLLLTLGESGMAVQTSRGQHLRVPAVARDVYDVSGAGDTVTAVAAVALAAGASVLEAAILANHAAAIEVAKAGVATVSPEEIVEQFNHYRGR